MNEKPYVVKFLGTLNLLIAILALFLSISSLLPEFLQTFRSYTIIQIPFYSNRILSIFIYMFLLITSYGFLKFKRWGYWLTILYYSFFLIAYIIGYLQAKYTFVSMNLIVTFIEIIFIIPTNKYFK